MVLEIENFSSVLWRQSYASTEPWEGADAVGLYPKTLTPRGLLTESFQTS